MKILVIDDEASTRDLLKMSLESDGYTVFMAENGPKGLEIFARENPPVVLTDIKMPGMDGIEVLRRVKEKSPDTEVIVITGHGEMNLAVQASNSRHLTLLTNLSVMKVFPLPSDVPRRRSGCGKN